MIAALSAALDALDAAPLAGESGRAVAARRTAAFDRAVVALFEPFAGAGVSVAAIGGYGRREMSPGSDLDLLFLYEPGVELEAVTQAVLYPLWDAGVRASQAVRTPGESRAECASNVQTLTATLDARPLAGPAHRVAAARDAAVELARSDVALFAAALRRSRIDREERFGRVGECLEPNLKEGVGGLRDVQIIRWLTLIGAAEGGHEDSPWADELLRVRAALHRVAGPGSDVLAADHHAAVATVLGHADEPGWEARDVLLRAVWSIGRVVAARCAEQLGDPGEGSPGELGRTPDLSSTGWTSARRSRFLAILGGETTGRELRRLDVDGALARLVPGWADIRGRPQRDPFHRYPVDVHLIETAAEAGRLLRGAVEPFAAEAVGLLDGAGREALVLGALLHDIGKVGRGSHVALGAETAAAALDDMGYEGGLRDDVVFLVREHLLLSDTATRRNVGDEDVVTRVGSRVGDPRRLALLYLLAVADAEATGPAASTPWRMGLIRALVARVDALFGRGLMDTGRAAGLSRSEAATRAALGALHPPSRVDRFLDAVPATYLTNVPAEDAPGHVGLILPPPGPGELRIHVGASRLPGSAQLAVAAADRIGALADIAGALSLSGLSIISAQVFTTEGGTVLDLFDVRGAFEADITEERWERFRSALGGVLSGAVDLREQLRRLRSQYRGPSADVPVAVRVSGGLSDFFTVVEVEAADRLGLLFDLCRAFAELGLDVHSARVATYGPRVVDVFDVTDEGGVKVTDEGRVVALEQTLRAAAAGEDRTSVG